MNTTPRRRLRTAVIIPAGGTGTRMRTRVPKQFLRLGKRSILEHTVTAFASIPQVVELVVACPPGHRVAVQRLLARVARGKIAHVVIGGRDRQESVWHALQALQSDAPVVLVHDAVRPFVSAEIITGVIDAAARHGAAVAAMPARDTVLRAGGKGMITGVIDRASCYLAQTPQGFRRDLLRRGFTAARRAGFHGTDDASLVLRLHHPVRVVPGADANFKITTPHDLQIARARVKPRAADRSSS